MDLPLIRLRMDPSWTREALWAEIAKRFPERNDVERIAHLDKVTIAYEVAPGGQRLAFHHIERRPPSLPKRGEVATYPLELSCPSFLAIEEDLRGKVACVRFPAREYWWQIAIIVSFVPATVAIWTAFDLGAATTKREKKLLLFAPLAGLFTLMEVFGYYRELRRKLKVIVKYSPADSRA